VIVSGGTGSIGRAIGFLFARLGARHHRPPQRRKNWTRSRLT
jgi:NAD(P)-dependent dehydrogenase (short-subunit alcohol dehydrogenase family)